jgi:hypothetical protein
VRRCVSLHSCLRASVTHGWPRCFGQRRPHLSAVLLSVTKTNIFCRRQSRRNCMTQINVSQILRLTAGILACWLGLIASVQAAEIQMQVQAAPATPTSPSPTGKLLTIEDAVRIGLDNHPRIKAVERTSRVSASGARPTNVSLLSDHQHEQFVSHHPKQHQRGQ